MDAILDAATGLLGESLRLFRRAMWSDLCFEGSSGCRSGAAGAGDSGHQGAEWAPGTYEEAVGGSRWTLGQGKTSTPKILFSSSSTA